MTAKTRGALTGNEDGEIADLASLLGAAGSGETGTVDSATGKPSDQAELAARLKACATLLAQEHAFRRGQLVQWKPGLKNRRNPAYGDPVVVVDVMDKPINDSSSERGAGSPYFMEPLTLVAGWIDKDGDFICYHYDGRRFEPFAREA